MLDEIGEISRRSRRSCSMCFRCEFTKLGSNKRIQVDVRIWPQPSCLEKMMLSGDFREDLYYRLKSSSSRGLRCGSVPTSPHAHRLLRGALSRKYTGRQAHFTELRQLFLQYSWPGNIRELENMIKRVVILQDEHLVVHEIQRNMQRQAAAQVAVAAPLAVAAAAAVGVPAGVGAFPGSFPPSPVLDDDGADESETLDEGSGGSLAAVAKAASLKAERAAIEQTLAQVHWNRRKALESGREL